MSNLPTKDMSVALAKHPEKNLWLGFRTVQQPDHAGLSFDFFGAQDDLALSIFEPFHEFANELEAAFYAHGVLDHYSVHGKLPNISGPLSTWPKPRAAACAVAA